MSQDFSHFDAHGQAAMVDVGAKWVTERTATARASASSSRASVSVSAHRISRMQSAPIARLS